jgi:type VI secretion system protein ImpK
MNSDSDPFSDASDHDYTILRPSPGGSQSPRSAASAHPRPRSALAGLPEFLYRSGLNPLVAAANPLLGLVSQLRYTVSYPDPTGLREQMVQEIRAFEAMARERGITHETVVAARYALCTLLDETVQSTPWGSVGVWNQQGLLVIFFNETWGGEKFFQLLKNALQYPAGNKDLLELLYTCLALGFKGRYRVINGGRAQLDELWERLFITLKNLHGHREPELSPHWQGVRDTRNPLIRLVPLWVVSAIAGVLLLAIFLGFSVSLNKVSDPVFATMHDIPGGKLPPVPPPVLPFSHDESRPSQPEGLAAFLEPEIRQGLVTVQELSNKTTVRILSDQLFPSGSVTVNSAYRPLFGRIAEALNTVPGKVLITGHTDDRPIRSIRFPSNWHLSQERAKNVLAILTNRVRVPTRLTAEGRAETEPLVPNNSPANQARNRRVEITILNLGDAL